jgi:hypothetical protein
MKSKYSSAAGLPTFNQLQKNKNRLQNDFTMLAGKSIKMV